MPDYANGKIYKIVGDTGITYYGSTTQSLKERMRQHPYNKGTTAHQKIISQMDWEIVLVENYPCESKKELEDREGWYIRENPCVNRVVVGRTKGEYREDRREELNTYARKQYEEKRKEKLESQIKRQRWIRSFGDPQYTNGLQRCDYMLFQ